MVLLEKKDEVVETYDISIQQDGICGAGCSSTPNILEEVVVGFDDEARKIVERLAGAQRHLEVISIVGMAGLGKTTLARKVYNDPFIVYHFHVRAWTYVSQVYQKRAVLLGILSGLAGDKDKIANSWSDGKVEAEVYKRLKGKKYFIVMDDMWKIGAWNDLTKCFPNDRNGSRILVTTRHMDVASYPQRKSIYPLRFLNHNESWSLIKRKVFGEGTCSLELEEIGKQIAETCQGLPLPIVVVAGVLAKENTQDWWKQVAKSVSSFIISDPKQIMNTLALSYIHLPPYLKPCFLYFGLFPENYEIPVKQLIWLWVAEGFIEKMEQKCLEDVAEDYLMDLIDKSLVLVTQRRSNGRIKACLLHDMLHDLVLRQCEEENFLQQICGYDQVSSSSSSSSIYDKQCRLCIRSHIFNYISSMCVAPHVSSFLCFASKSNELSQGITLYICQKLKRLTILDLLSIHISFFPSEIVKLVLLRYLALGFEDGSLPPSVSNLENLETIILRPRGKITLPQTIWNMLKLRHIFIRGGENDIEHSKVEQMNSGYSRILNNLQTISQISPSPRLRYVLSRTPNLRKLGLCGPLQSAGNLALPGLHNLQRLETLKLRNCSTLCRGPFNLQYFEFPQNVRQLILSHTRIGWNQLSTLGLLPNLEVLKLLYHACVGPRWVTRFGRFCRFKFLKFQFIDIEHWSTDSSHFPALECVVLIECRKLEGIPSDLGEIPTLDMIEVRRCSHLAGNSARRMKEEQDAVGNNGLKIYIQDLEPATDS